MYPSAPTTAPSPPMVPMSSEPSPGRPVEGASVRNRNSTPAPAKNRRLPVHSRCATQVATPSTCVSAK